MCLQANWARKNRETHQESLERDHDAEGPWERHLKRCMMQIHILKITFRDDFINSVESSHVYSAHAVPAHTLLFRSARSWRCRWCVTYGSLRSTLIMRWLSSWGRWTGPQRFSSMFTWWEWCHPHILIIHFIYVVPSVIFELYLIIGFWMECI